MRSCIVSSLMTVTLLGGSWLAPQPLHAEAARAERSALCRGPAAEDAAYEAFAQRERIREDRRRPPMKVFDNLYFVGTSSTLAWAVDTPDGIVLLDSLNAPDVDVVVDGLKALGLDPARIRYVLVSHGHADHFGGATILQERYGARVVMGAADWPFAAAKHPEREPPPRKDIDAPDRITVGGITFRFIPTPGHTPGATSMLFPVTDHGRRHVVAFVAAIGKPDRAADIPAYFHGIEGFRDAAARAGADVLLAGHPFNDDSLAKMRALREHPGGPNPFVIGKAALRAELTTSLECGRAAFAARPPP